MLAEMATQTGGSVVNIQDPISKLGTPNIKTVRPVCLYRGTLTLGYIDKLEHATMKIDVQQWPCVMQAKPQQEKQFAGKPEVYADGTAQSSVTMQESGPLQDGLSVIKRTRAYQVDDEDAPGGKRDVDKEQLEKGFEYGRTAVHVNEDDMDSVKLETRSGLEVVGFALREKVGFEVAYIKDRANRMCAV
jgi:ATP-dependent DNA helicase 2 subunit 2